MGLFSINIPMGPLPILCSCGYSGFIPGDLVGSAKCPKCSKSYFVVRCDYCHTLDVFRPEPPPEDNKYVCLGCERKNELKAESRVENLKMVASGELLEKDRLLLSDTQRSVRATIMFLVVASIVLIAVVLEKFIRLMG